MNYCLDGRTVIITGAARGIGQMMVKMFLEQEAHVVAVDRDEIGLNETKKECPSAHILVEDISTNNGAERVVCETLKLYGRFHICVNNAAVAPHTILINETQEVWDKIFAINCRGTFLMTKYASSAMKKLGVKGRIINFSSAASVKGGPGTAAYASSRAAVEAFSRVAAVELAPSEILVNVISPGLIDTQPKPWPSAMAKELSRRIPLLPLARSGNPDEVAQVALFLASDASSYITGTVIHVDGGASIGNRYCDSLVDDDPRYKWITG